MEPKPTIEELEAILNNPQEGLIEILPDGEVRTVSGEDVAQLRARIVDLEKVPEDGVMECRRCGERCLDCARTESW